MINKLADIPLYPPSTGKLEGRGTLGLEGGINAETAPFIFAYFISVVIGVMTIVAFIWFLFLIIIGAIGIMGAGGDKAKVSEARSKITNGLIGLVIVISAIFIARLVAAVFGLNLNNLMVVILNLR